MATSKPKPKSSIQPSQKATVPLRVRSKPTKSTRSGAITKAAVAHKAAAGRTNSEIARELNLSERRIEQIVSEPNVKLTIEQYRVALERTRINAEARLLDGLLERFKATPGTAGLPFAELVEKRLTNAERRGGGESAGTATQININQGQAVTLDQLLEQHRPEAIDAEVE